MTQLNMTYPAWFYVDDDAEKLVFDLEDEALYAIVDVPHVLGASSHIAALLELYARRPVEIKQRDDRATRAWSLAKLYVPRIYSAVFAAARMMHADGWAPCDITLNIWGRKTLKTQLLIDAPVALSPHIVHPTSKHA